MKHGMLILSLFVCCHLATANTWHVGKGKGLRSVNAAILAAANGDTILVYAGTYYEKNIIVNKKLLLKGIGHPVLDGEKKYEVISVKANGSVIDGFTIVHSGVSSMEDMGGIKIYDSRDVVIQNNILEDTFFGIYVQYGKNCTVQNNQLVSYNPEEQQSGNGIHCWKSDSLRIIGNKITGHRDGIYFEFVTNSIIWLNTSFKNIRYGLHFMFSHNDAYIANHFRDNGAGVAVMFSHGVKMYSNVFEENWGDAAYGLLLKEISDSYIDGNTFIKNTSGIYMEGASRIHMQKNLFKNNGWGMKIQASCMDIEVTLNNFIGNTFDVSTNGSLVLNSFNRNYWDKYDGYDLNKDKIGDVPYRPVSMYSMIVEKNPPAMLLFRSFITSLLDKTEKVIPSLTPEALKDNSPLMKRLF
ncbi:MAG: nitrous oxide reductase family maturation protein NosD [Chitinophagaceae bacterium]|nr:nitrous oxide reductase family maturation protein NosD [Chitinophagaceae bacterium]MDP1763464.1 nitrous oxide reductase family maturation protein NosD [Sediminibacterium sp.]MDP1811902.1 nitrous oxide reductase family maturation protein NosD [Sediminibacterium sp.]MDP3128467.1 nitrous oxide reductase family maturation protein NosD [Sediminibacterium sp.]MDP3666134.1 nitrous oxide reductase family maturation protein NosD [Sediminibacterium sp.]